MANIKLALTSANIALYNENNLRRAEYIAYYRLRWLIDRRQEMNQYHMAHDIYYFVYCRRLAISDENRRHSPVAFIRMLTAEYWWYLIKQVYDTSQP